jgi:hypothetical protein
MFDYLIVSVSFCRPYLQKYLCTLRRASLLRGRSWCFGIMIKEPPPPRVKGGTLGCERRMVLNCGCLYELWMPPCGSNYGRMRDWENDLDEEKLGRERL